MCMLNLIRNWQSVLVSGCDILHFHQKCMSFHYSTSLSTLGIVYIFYFSNCNRCVVETFCFLLTTFLKATAGCDSGAIIFFFFTPNFTYILFLCAFFYVRKKCGLLFLYLWINSAFI